MYSIYYRSTKDAHLKKLEVPRSGSWIHIENATVDDINTVAGLVGLTDEDIDDSLDPQEAPRIEQENKDTIIFLRDPSPEFEGLYTQPLTIIVTPEYIVTLTQQQNQTISGFIENPNGMLTTQRTKFLLSILLKIVGNYTREMRNIRAQVQKRNQFKNTNAQDIIDLTKNEQVLNQYLAALIPSRNVFETLANGKYVDLFDDDNNLLEDLTITIRQSVDVCTVELKSIQSIRNAHQIIFNNDLNKTIKLLTSFTIIMTIPTIVASLYGMNVNLPLGDHPVAFGIIMLIIFMLSITSIYIFRKLRWI